MFYISGKGFEKEICELKVLSMHGELSSELNSKVTHVILLENEEMPEAGTWKVLTLQEFGILIQ